MTKVISITSGVAGLGKTHIAINLSLELVRRGRLVGLFHVPGGASPVDHFIDIQPLVDRRQQDVAEQDSHHVITRGYLGVDIVSCTIPLLEWATLTDEQLARCVQDMDVEEGYEDFIVDTSCMAPRELVASCLASALVVLVVTPDADSQAEAFALLRVLRLNGFTGGLRLLVNRAADARHAQAIHDSFNRETSQHLDLVIEAPWVILEDDSVARAERYRQAFSAVFPDAEAAAGIVHIADALATTATEGDPRSLSDWWADITRNIRAPIQLPGEAWLDGAGEGGEDLGQTEAENTAPALSEELS